jgi:hypothetical protein
MSLMMITKCNKLIEVLIYIICFNVNKYRVKEIRQSNSRNSAVFPLVANETLIGKIIPKLFLNKQGV